MEEIESLNRARTPSGVRSATWLELYGKKDIWKPCQHDQCELESKDVGKLDKKDLKLVLSMAKISADALAARYQQSAPYVIEPSLRKDHIVRPGAVCPCSYPSRHAARAAGSPAHT